MIDKGTAVVRTSEFIHFCLLAFAGNLLAYPCITYVRQLLLKRVLWMFPVVSFPCLYL